MPSGAKTYKDIELQAKINEATPHQLIQMLFDGLQGNLLRARTCAERGDKHEMDYCIEKAIAIIMGLHSSLSTEVESELPYNLSRLYEYMQRQLLRARIGNTVSILNEVICLTEPLVTGWREIGDKLPSR